MRTSRPGVLVAVIAVAGSVVALFGQGSKPERPIQVDKVMNERMAELARQRVLIDQVFDRLRLSDLGWDRTVSTVAFKGGLQGYYEEMGRP